MVYLLLTQNEGVKRGMMKEEVVRFAMVTRQSGERLPRSTILSPAALSLMSKVKELRSGKWRMIPRISDKDRTRSVGDSPIFPIILYRSG